MSGPSGPSKNTFLLRQKKNSPFFTKNRQVFYIESVAEQPFLGMSKITWTTWTTWTITSINRIKESWTKVGPELDQSAIL